MKICLVCEGISDTEKDHCAACGLRLVSTSEVHFPLRRGEEDASNPLLSVLVDGKYRITNVLGKGGMGTVYRAVHEVSLVPVALKILHPRFGTRPDYRDHFVAEARKAGRVVHEHSSRVLDVGEDADGTVYIAMELVEGVTLAEWIHSEERLGAAEVADIMHQVCQALAVAHGVGLVHRDLSPRNIMGVVRDGRPFVKILDFGISKGAASPPAVAFSDADGSAAPAGFANPPYSAPEHIAGEEVDARADIYSLGVIAYEALTRKLPVRGSSKRELAAATLAGGVQPMRAPAGTPGGLVRLVHRMLSLDPEDRPASAQEVRRELDRIRNPRALGLRMAALGALLVTLPAFLLTHWPDRLVFLEVRGSELSVQKRRELEAKPQELHSQKLANLEFRFGGFDPAELELIAYADDGSEIHAENLQPVVDPSGEVLTLSATKSPGYRDFLAELAAASKGFRLVFRTPGRPALGYAEVFVDDESPAVSLSTTAQGDVLNADALLILRAPDKGTLEMLHFEVSCGGQEPEPVRVDGEVGGPAADILGFRFGRVEGYDDVVLRARARDGARNEGRDELAFRRMDLRAPRIDKIEGRRGGPVTYGSTGAQISVHLDAYEAGAKLLVRSRDGVSWEKELGLSTVQEVLLESKAGDHTAPFVDGTYTFAVRDAAGNQSPDEEFALRFFSEDLQPRLLAPAGVGAEPVHARVIEENRRVVTDGSALTFELVCNEFYAPFAAELLSANGSDRFPVEVRDSRAGRCLLDVPELGDGRFALSIYLRDQVDAETAYEYDLRVFSQPVALRLPVDALQQRFVNQLQKIGLVTFDAQSDRIGLGNAWSLTDEIFVEGRIWLGLVDGLEPHLLTGRPGERLDLPQQSILPGRNVMGVELRDRLGRAVEVRFGLDAAPPLEGQPGAYRIAEFWHSPVPMESTPSSIRVEYDQSSKLVVRSLLPFDEGDTINLLLGAGVAASRVERREDTSLLTFWIPYDALASELGWADSEPAELAAGLEKELTVEIETPAGKYDVSAVCESIRSALKAVTWGEVAALAGRELDPPLASIEMVPVLAPAGGEYHDPVGDVQRRGDFRPMPRLDVFNVRDVFVQSSEITRAQYQSLLEHFGRADLAERPPDTAFVHPWDPRGTERLQQLPPTSRWKQLVEDGPDRLVTGVNFFQAYTVSRIAGYVLAGDPDALRLPMGVELELAALESSHAGALNGCESLFLDAFEAFARHRRALDDEWPPSLEQLRSAGDLVRLTRGYETSEVLGLDFGVREWVLDLPFQKDHEVLQVWLENHGHHVEQALGAPVQNEALLSNLARYGVVRGAAIGDESALLDTNQGELLDRELQQRHVPSSVPGVTRMLILQRDGLGLLDQEDPHLQEIGFRLVGGEAFVRRARAVDAVSGGGR